MNPDIYANTPTSIEESYDETNGYKITGRYDEYLENNCEGYA